MLVWMRFTFRLLKVCEQYFLQFEIFAVDHLDAQSKLESEKMTHTFFFLFILNDKNSVNIIAVLLCTLAMATKY